MNNFFALILAFAFTLFSNSLNAQTKIYDVSGAVTYSSFHQGGIDQEHLEIQQYPLLSQEFVLVKLDSVGAQPKKFNKFKTDSEGYFDLELPAGIYGIVLEKDLRKLEKGQFTPTGSQSGDQWTSTSETWGMASPIIVDGHVRDIQLNRHSSSICYMCP